MNWEQTPSPHPAFSFLWATLLWYFCHHLHFSILFFCSMCLGPSNLLTRNGSPDPFLYFASYMRTEALVFIFKTVKLKITDFSLKTNYINPAKWLARCAFSTPFSCLFPLHRLEKWLCTFPPAPTLKLEMALEWGVGGQCGRQAENHRAGLTFPCLLAASNPNLTLEAVTVILKQWGKGQKSHRDTSQDFNEPQTNSSSGPPPDFQYEKNYS